MYKLVYVNWYMFYTNSHKRTCIYQLVYVNWYIFVSWIKIIKMLSPKNGDSPLTPGMWESVRSLPNSLRYHLFSHKRKPKNHLKPEIVRIQLEYIMVVNPLSPPWKKPEKIFSGGKGGRGPPNFYNVVSKRGRAICPPPNLVPRGNLSLI